MSTSQLSAAAIESWCVDYVSKTLHVPQAGIDPHMKVEGFGLDSATAVALIMDLEQWLDMELTPDLLFEYPTLASLSGYLASQRPLAGAA